MSYFFHIFFSIIWVLTGNEEDVEQTNFNQVAILEKRLNQKGLGEYLKGNYIQYYARNSEEIETPDATTAYTIITLLGGINNPVIDPAVVTATLKSLS